jgi:hypothetical protein
MYNYVMENDSKSEEAEKLPRVIKELELKMMIEMVEAGLWTGTNLAKALHVDKDTIGEWKKRPEVIAAHKKAILKFCRKRTDTDKILKELGIEIEPDDLSIQNNLLINLTDEQLTNFISAKIRQIGASQVIDGEVPKNE